MDILIILFVFAFWLGWRISAAWHEHMHTEAFKSILEDMGATEAQMRKVARKNNIKLKDEQPEDDLEEIHIKLEQHQGQIYAFRVDNDGFLAQGQDRESLLNHLKQRMNNVRLVIDEGGELIQKAEKTQIG